jgi:lipopolysaccharide/colanic/teichoic acid biosynthesis glycosyltransferase
MAGKLLSVTPGLSGLWQVSGRSDVSYDERIRMDMAYIDRRSLWLDTRLILQTMMVVLRGRGAC